MATYFNFINHELYAEGVPLSKIAREVGTPCYLYSYQALQDAWLQFEQAFSTFPHQINAAVKANSNIAILELFAKLGSGFDIVSQGELERVLKAGANPKKIVFSGVGKSASELGRAIDVDVGCINVESRSELHRLNQIAKEKNKKVNINIRVNPDVNAKSHPYISTGLKENKFGIHLSQAKSVFHEAHALPFINLQGIAFHIGSQILTLSPILEALEIVLRFVDECHHEGILLEHLDVGGGLGVRYFDENPPSPHEYIQEILQCVNNRKLTVHIEPGRALSANAGLLLTRIEYIKESFDKEKYFAIVDAAMNDLLRPSLYSVWHDIVPVFSSVDPADIKEALFDIVGPICESGDFLGKNRLLKLKEEDLLAIMSAGAYGFCMSSNYNSRPRPPEVMVRGENFQIIRSRETFAELFSNEALCTL